MQGDVVFFDGYCNLCNSSVQFIIARDTHKRFLFATLEGSYATQNLEKEYINQKINSGLVLKRGAKVYTKSSAALQIARYLNGFWPLFFVFWIVPKPFRDWVYGLVAKNRYRFFGKSESCWIPSPDLQSRFL